MRPWKDHENVPEIGAKIIWRSLEIEQVLSLTLLPRPHNTFELQHTKEEVATKIERQSGAQRGPPPPRRVQEQVRNTRLTVPAIFQLPQAGRGAHRSDPALNPGPGPQRSKGCGLARGHTLAGLVVHWRGWCGPFSSLALACLLRARGRPRQLPLCEGWGRESQEGSQDQVSQLTFG